MAKKYFSLFFTLMLLFSSQACRKNGKNGIPPAPDTQIVYPLDSDTLNNALITCQWTGYDNAEEFRFKLDSNTWSAWKSDTSATVFLDEGMHTLIVTSRETEFNREDLTPDSIAFYIDAISGPALWIKKREIETTVSQPVSFTVLAEDVRDLMLGYIELTYDNAKIKIDSISPEEDFLTMNGGEIQMITEHADSLPYAKVTFGIIGGVPKGVSGTGSLFTVNFLLKSPDSTIIGFSASTNLRDTVNTTISLTGMWSCIIIPSE